MSDFPPNLSIRPLTIEDLPQCVEVENVGFANPAERCTPDKFKYRLTTCPELCSGIFIRDYEYKYNAVNLPDVATRLKLLQHADTDDDLDELPVKSSVTKETLIGHILATKIAGSVIADSDMDIPSPQAPDAGHRENSRFIGIHSVVVVPEWQGKNLGTLLLHDYIQKLSNQDLGDKISIIAHKELVPFYEKIGFSHIGKSACEFGGEAWEDMSIDLVAEDDL